MRFVFFKNTADGILQTGPPGSLPPGYTFRVWQPSITRVYPRELLDYHGSCFSVFAWWVLQYVFSINRIYRVMLIYHHGELVHYTLLSPKNLRCPFMKKGDAKLGMTWTHEKHRGRGLATFGVKQLVSPFRGRNMDFWWYCDADNHASIALAKKLGLKYVGKGDCKPRLGIQQLRYFYIMEFE